MKKIIATIISMLVMLCCLSSCIKLNVGNVQFSSTEIDSITYNSQEVELSSKSESKLLSVLDGKTWRRVEDNFNSANVPSQIVIKVNRTVTNNNEIYQKGNYSFRYMGDLDKGVFYLDNALLSSFTQCAVTTLNENDIKALKDVFKDFVKPNPPAPEGNYTLRVIDEGHHIYSVVPNNSSGKYVPDTEIKFYSNPLTDADLAMYVDEQYVGVQTVTETDGGYVWEFSLKMPARETTVKFQVKTVQYESLSALYPWINGLELDDIETVLSYDGLGSVAPRYTALNTYYIGNANDKQQTFEFLKNGTVVKSTDPYRVGVGEKALIIKLKDGTTRTLNHYAMGFSVNNQYYKYSSFPSFSEYYGNSFLPHCVFTLYNGDNLVKQNVEEMKNIVFSACSGDDYTREDKFLTYAFLMEGDKIYILNSQTFYIYADNQLKYYRILNGYTFDDILNLG